MIRSLSRDWGTGLLVSSRLDCGFVCRISERYTAWAQTGGEGREEGLTEDPDGDGVVGNDTCRGRL